MTPDVTRLPKARAHEPSKRARMAKALPRRAVPLLRTALSRRPSRKKRREQAELDRAIAVVRVRSKGRCEILWSTNVCRVWAVGEPHHRQLRSQGGPHVPGNLLDCCGPCHTTAHANRNAARARRIILHRYEGDGGWPDPEERA